MSWQSLKVNQLDWTSQVVFAKVKQGMEERSFKFMLKTTLELKELLLATLIWGLKSQAQQDESLLGLDIDVPHQDQKQKQDIGLVRCGKLCQTKKLNKESMKRRKGKKLLKNIKEIKKRGDSQWLQHQHI